MRKVLVLVMVGSVLLIILFVSKFVWLPDVLTGQVIVLNKLAITNGDQFLLSQLFNGDGYLTEFVHLDRSGRRWSVVIDGDAKKAWRGELTEGTNDLIAINLWNQQFYYNPESHMMIELHGKPWAAYEIPQMKPASPPR